MTERSCEKCEFYVRRDLAENVWTTECHRFPPNGGHWPSADSWCGEFRLREVDGSGGRS